MAQDRLQVATNVFAGNSLAKNGWESTNSILMALDGIEFLEINSMLSRFLYFSCNKAKDALPDALRRSVRWALCVGR